jgi:hypothetical protein
VASTVYDDDSRRHDAAGYQRPACDDGAHRELALSGIEGWKDEIYVNIYLEH